MENASVAYGAVQTIQQAACRLKIEKAVGGTDRSFPIGHISTDDKGYKIMKVAELGGGHRSWRRLHLVLWEERYGAVPKTHRVCFSDYDRGNCCIENLVLKTHAEHLRDNRK